MSDDNVSRNGDVGAGRLGAPSIFGLTSSLDTLAKVITAGAILPVIGTLHRALSFFLSGIPTSVAGMASIADLGLLAFGILLPGLLLGATLAYFFRDPSTVAIPRDIHIPTSVRTRLGGFKPHVNDGVVTAIKRLFRFRIVSFLFAVALVGGVFALLNYSVGPWLIGALLESRGPGNLLTNLATTIVIFYGLSIGRGVEVVPVRRLFPIVVVLTIVVAVASSLGPNTSGATLVDVRFNTDAGLKDGTYYLLGDDADVTWVWSCAQASQPIIRIPSTAIAQATVASPGPAPQIPTLRESVDTGRWVAGFVPRCP